MWVQAAFISEMERLTKTNCRAYENEYIRRRKVLGNVNMDQLRGAVAVVAGLNLLLQGFQCDCSFFHLKDERSTEIRKMIKREN
jgi:hypothetical protein